jgi:predicted AlkP superfamily phosphohydrolase/phosphomutase
MLIDPAHVPDSGNDLGEPALPDLAGESTHPAHADVLVCHIPHPGTSDADYLSVIESRLAPLAETVTTWLVACPTHRVPVTARFHVNQWLIQQQYLAEQKPAGDTATAAAPDHARDFATGSAFYTGPAESGLRINRVLTYKTGTVQRADYERIRKDLAAALRSIDIPGSGNSTAETPLFTKIFRGEQIYSGRGEGRMPDLAWESSDESIELDASLLPGPDDPPWQVPAEPQSAVRSGGWFVFRGPAFLTRVGNPDVLEGLTAADIAPTVLFLLSCPIARDMQGNALQTLMTETMQIRIPAFTGSYSLDDPLVQQEF